MASLSFVLVWPKAPIEWWAGRGGERLVTRSVLAQLVGVSVVIWLPQKHRAHSTGHTYIHELCRNVCEPPLSLVVCAAHHYHGRYVSICICVCVCVDPKMTTQKEAHRRQLTTATSTARAAGQVNTKGPVLYYLCRGYIYYAYIKYTTFKVRTCQKLTQ